MTGLVFHIHARLFGPAEREEERCIVYGQKTAAEVGCGSACALRCRSGSQLLPVV